MLDAYRSAKLTFWLLALTCLISTGEAAEHPYSERFTQLKSIENQTFRQPMTEAIRRKHVLSAYAELFPLRAMTDSNLSTEDRRALFKSSEIAAFYGQSPIYVHQMEAGLRLLEGSGEATGADYAKMQGIYIMMRMIPEAVSIARSHPVEGMESVLPIKNDQDIRKGKPSRLLIADDHLSLQYDALNLHGKQMIVIAHPACHFSQDAVHEMETRHKDLQSLFSKAIWLTPPGVSLDINAISRWNNEHPSAHLALTYRQSDWAVFDDWATPTFYFLDNGKIVDKVTGWPPQGGYDQLYRAIDRWKQSR